MTVEDNWKEQMLRLQTQRRRETTPWAPQHIDTPNNIMIPRSHKKAPHQKKETNRRKKWVADTFPRTLPTPLCHVIVKEWGELVMLGGNVRTVLFQSGYRCRQDW